MKKAIIGYGGLAKEISQYIPDLTFFVDPEYVCDLTRPLSQFNAFEYEAMVCVGDPALREKLIKKLPINTTFFSFIHPTALILGNINIGYGSFIGPYSILNTDTNIGNHAILVRMVSIGHDCTIGNFFSAMPGSVVSGHVCIGDCVYLGSNASIKEKINICNNTIFGLNSGVINNITDSGVYVGCPANLIKKYSNNK